MRKRGTPKWKIESFHVPDASGVREIVWRSNGKVYQQLYTYTSVSIAGALDWARRNRLKLVSQVSDLVVCQVFDNNDTDSYRWYGEMWCTQPHMLYKHDKEANVRVGKSVLT